MSIAIKKLVPKNSSNEIDDELKAKKGKPVRSSRAAADSMLQRAYYWDEDDFVCAGTTRVRCSSFKQLSPTLVASLKIHFLAFADLYNYSRGVVRKTITAIKDGLDLFPTSNFDDKWIAKCLSEARFFRFSAAVAKFFVYWKTRDAHAISPEGLLLLTRFKWRREARRNVLSDDPEKSWLTDIEYDLLLNKTWDAYDAGIADTQLTLIRLLSMQYARRPRQIAHLKLSDFFEGTDEMSGITGRMVKFPGVKDKLATQGFRDSKLEVHPIADHLWDLYLIQSNDIISLFERMLRTKLSSEERILLPLFTSETQIKHAAAVISDHYLIDPRLNLSNELFHITPELCSRILRWEGGQLPSGVPGKTYNKIPTPLSHRTNRSLVVSGTRMRHTKARQLARLGTPKFVLSHWLGHTHEKSLDAYYNDPAEEARQINEAMASRLNPLAMAFAGKLIDDETQATRAGDLDSILEMPSDGNLKYVGNCGKHSFCATTSVPIPCYRCKYFEPLVFAPHQEVLDALLTRQKEEQSMIKIGGSRKLLAPIDLSSDIRAVRACINLCAQRAAQLAKINE